MPTARACQRLSIPVFALVLAVSAAPARAQPFRLDAPADSPFWWTLDDSRTPAALRRELQDPEAHRRRYRQAVAAGLEKPLDDARLSHLEYYQNPALDPLLEPLWHAFHFFANYWLPEDGAEKAQSALASFGVSTQGAAAVLAGAGDESRRFAALIEELRPSQSEYLEMVWEANGTRGGGAAIEPRILQATKDHDVAFLASRSGRSPAEVRRLLEISQRDPGPESAVPVIVTLRDTLTHDDWQALRRYLVEQVAHRLATASDF